MTFELEFKVRELDGRMGAAADRLRALEDRMSKLEAVYPTTPDGPPTFTESVVVGEWTVDVHVSTPERDESTAIWQRQAGRIIGMWLVAGVCRADAVDVMLEEMLPGLQPRAQWEKTG